ncbi:MAG TPA: hypothetical protein DD412_05775 [Holosporales bacterium]|nr:hypothetical protein [Holosporales bacterium]
MLKNIYFFTSFFIFTLSNSYGSFRDFSDLTAEEARIVYNIVPPSLLTIDGQLCGPPSLNQIYRSQAEKAIVSYRAELKQREELKQRAERERIAQHQRLREFGFLLADTPLEDWGVTIPHPALVIENPATVSFDDKKVKPQLWRDDARAKSMLTPGHRLPPFSPETASLSSSIELPMGSFILSPSSSLSLPILVTDDLSPNSRKRNRELVVQKPQKKQKEPSADVNFKIGEKRTKLT